MRRLRSTLRQYVGVAIRSAPSENAIVKLWAPGIRAKSGTPARIAEARRKNIVNTDQLRNHIESVRAVCREFLELPNCSDRHDSRHRGWE